MSFSGVDRYPLCAPLIIIIIIFSYHSGHCDFDQLILHLYCISLGSEIPHSVRRAHRAALHPRHSHLVTLLFTCVPKTGTGLIDYPSMLQTLASIPGGNRAGASL